MQMQKCGCGDPSVTGGDPFAVFLLNWKYWHRGEGQLGKHEDVVGDMILFSPYFLIISIIF